MKADPHLYQTEVPIVEGQTYEVLCGKEVSRAKFVLMFDAIEMAMPLRLLKLRCCRKCMEKLADSSAEPWQRERYIYGIKSATELEEENLEAA